MNGAPALRHSALGFSRWRTGAAGREAIGALVTALAVAGAVAVLVPFAWMLITSLKGPGELMAIPPRWIPQEWRWDNYARAWQAAPFGRFFLNTAVVAGASVAGQIVTATLAGYALARMRFRGRQTVLAAILATMAIPGEATLLPAYLLMRELGWVDTYLALIVPNLAGAFGIFLMRQAMVALPRALEDAAFMDGASRWTFVWRVAAPLCRPTMATLALLTFLGQWNSYLWPLIVTNSEALRPVQIGLRYFINQELGNDWALLMAGSVLVAVPTVVAFLAAQRQFIEGLAAGAVRG
ncbi:carbohydrate ABC transporter permease [Carboxydochorda subterranea]|uniref:Carbohydrate ABC transporter permease n=1 Tax=Carboxydichorda subterranea TaxID=3109565 RepID=A0ABZ1BZN4_9FIRM|nr:carbohydrate ABC transporter permease [Limnochorda sp. L945t]WRP17542.1 carbohydrate ABC transporter permease [Limnochorda sp. L945t]